MSLRIIGWSARRVKGSHELEMFKFSNSIRVIVAWQLQFLLNSGGWRVSSYLNRLINYLTMKEQSDGLRKPRQRQPANAIITAN